ncbi:MAG TPA: hypothetical protein VF883_00415 [Thermoanaerobaculia bacterium]|jgi:uncharacterized membrane protein
MTLWPLLLFHICCAVVGLLSGAMAMIFRKGSGRHGAAGTVFFVSMLFMSSSAAWIALVFRPNALNVVVSLLTFYLVSTGWWTAKRRTAGTNAFDLVAMLFVLAVGITGVTFGFEAADSAMGTKDHMPAPIYFVFGTIALLCAMSDLRMIVRGGITGGRRVARHLGRMGLALLIATMSLYPGQAKLFSQALRDTNLLLLPLFLLIGSLVFWQYRVRRTTLPKPAHV